MKVLLFNGSPRQNGCTAAALGIIAEELEKQGVQSEILWLGNQPVRDCIGCGGCKTKGRCVFDDDIINEWIDKAGKADGFVFGSPVYYAHPRGAMLCAMDRLFYAGGKNFAHKPGAVVTSARRAGTTASLDALLKHLTIAQMPVVSSTYWNMVHGATADDVAQDAEGVQTMRNLAQNIAYLLKCIQAGKQAGIAPPDTHKTERTNFIRR